MPISVFGGGSRNSVQKGGGGGGGDGGEGFISVKKYQKVDEVFIAFGTIGIDLLTSHSILSTQASSTCFHCTYQILCPLILYNRP